MAYPRQSRILPRKPSIGILAGSKFTLKAIWPEFVSHPISLLAGDQIRPLGGLSRDRRSRRLRPGRFQDTACTLAGRELPRVGQGQGRHKNKWPWRPSHATKSWRCRWHQTDRPKSRHQKQPPCRHPCRAAPKSNQSCPRQPRSVPPRNHASPKACMPNSLKLRAHQRSAHCGCSDDLEKIFRLQRGASHEAAINVWLSKQFGSIRRVHAAAVKQANTIRVRGGLPSTAHAAQHVLAAPAQAKQLRPVPMAHTGS